MQNLLLKIKNALVSIDGLKVYHYWRPRMEAPYCLWQEETEDDALYSSNHKAEQSISGTIDYYTLQEFDPMVDTIQETLNTVENLGWSLATVDYEDDTNLIHYSWNWTIA